jgi:hypothetical protein
MDDYLKLVSELPLPTIEQTRAFSDHVSKAHSWYKRLPVIPPGHVFLFFLDPQAGRIVHEYGRHDSPTMLASAPKGVHRPLTTITDIKDQSRCGHYSMKPTCDYLAQFGHWNYALCSSTDFPTFNPHVWSLEQVDLGSDLLIEPFEVPVQVAVPDKVCQQCYCQLTAFIRGYAMYRCSLRQLPTFLQDFTSYLEAKPQSSWAETLRKLRWDLEEAGLYGWQPDITCDIEIAGQRSRFRVTEYAKNVEQLRIVRNLCFEFDLGSLAAEELTAQRAALDNGLQRSRELFAKVCRGVS